ncbi:hypothetical protein B0J14DRAFT_366463 [Halenospora varia]|nr:hypothetical protein B0J14DRAFT_366463 [Halenospora varia]
MHLILTGATGLVGSGVLHSMLTNASVSKVSILSRRPVPLADGHSKANVIIHKDFSSYPSEVLEQLKDADGVVWAQGISMMQVPKDQYEVLTHDYPLSFAKAISSTTSPKPFKFVYVSGEGATTKPTYFSSLFAIVKGRTEADLLALSKDPAYSNLRPFSVRPGGVDPTHHPEIQGHFNQRMGMEKFGGILLPILRATYKGMVSPTKDLGVFLTGLAMGDGAPLEGKGIEAEGRTINNVGFRRLAGI